MCLVVNIKLIVYFWKWVRSYFELDVRLFFKIKLIYLWILKSGNFKDLCYKILIMYIFDIIYFNF